MKAIGAAAAVSVAVTLLAGCNDKGDASVGMPGDFVPPPVPPAEATVPLMGLHWADQTLGHTPHEYQFTQEIIRGSWDGNVTFIEPMITREWLLSHTALDEQLKQPAAYQRSGRYPTTYTVHYHATRDEYSVALGGFTQRDAS
jgi:hypothetical protein